MLKKKVSIFVTPDQREVEELWPLTPALAPDQCSSLSITIGQEDDYPIEALTQMDVS